MSGRDVINILGGLSMEIMISSKSSNNTCCVVVETTPPGAGPPVHRHLREEEVFTVLEGEYEFYHEGIWSRMEVGVSVLSLRGIYHAFRNVGTFPGRMMFTTNGGGIDEYFRAISTLCLPQDIDRLAEISSHFGYEFLPPS